MKNKFALLLDGGFVISKLSKRLKQFPSADDVVRGCNRIMEHPQILSNDLIPDIKQKGVDLRIGLDIARR